MKRADLILDELARNRVEFVTWLPDSETHFLHEALFAREDMKVVPTCSEGDALAAAAGMNVAGKVATVVIEDQGLYDSGNVLKWLKTLNTPMVLVVGYLFYAERGSFGYLEPFLDAFGIPYHIVDSDGKVEEISTAYEEARSSNGVVAVLLASADGYAPGTGDAVQGGYPQSSGAERTVTATRRAWAKPTVPRASALKIVADARDDAVVITTMSVIQDWPDVAGTDGVDFQVGGAMGYATSFGLGVALARPDRRVIVLEGDGSLLMNLGVLVSVTEAAPPNLVLALMENGVYELTGGIRTPGLGRVDFCALASACGWEEVHQLTDVEQMETGWPELIQRTGPSFISLKIAMGPPKALVIGAPSGIERLRTGLAGESAGARQ
jgi:thiamine pyrophosphate-dependent acetolactate synthase large subunit-like protein